MSNDVMALLDSMGGRAWSLAAGEYLFHLGEPVATLFVVRAGHVHLLRHQEDGGAIILQRAGAGEILAEASLFSEQYHCDAIAWTDAVVARIPKQALLERLRTEPAFAEGLAAHLARAIQNTRFRCEVLSLRTVAARLDAWTAWHGGLPPKGEWKTLAEQIGVTPEALYREIGKRRKPSKRAPSERSPASTRRGRRP